MKTTKFDVIVLGAGAAGLMCAQTAGHRGRRVLVLEKANKVGKKILMSGGGRCNFTNMELDPRKHYLSQNPNFCLSALARYNQWDFLDLVAKHDIPWHEKEAGQLFCDNSSRDILNLLLNECRDAKVQIQTQTEIQSIEPLPGHAFKLHAGETHYECNSLVIATGGLSIPKAGGSGFGYQVARQFGHEIIPTRAGLVPLTWNNRDKPIFEVLSGLSTPVSVKFQRKVFDHSLLFTHRGLSGPAILQISSYWDQSQPLSINWLPHLNTTKWLREQRQSNGGKRLRQILASEQPQRLSQVLANLLYKQDQPLGQISNASLEKISNGLKQWAFQPGGSEGYRTAEVTLGGVCTRSISSKTLESENQPNLYFIGEVVDVTGHLGGFNFQWAWASGHCAGLYV